MKENPKNAPQAPDWQLEPMEKTQEAQETKLELEPMTQEEAAEKYSITEEFKGPSVEETAALSSQREQIASMAAERFAESPAEQPEKRTERVIRNYDDAYGSERASLLRDTTEYRPRDGFVSGDFRKDFAKSFSEMTDKQKNTRRLATAVASLPAVGTALFAGFAGAGAVTAAPFLAVPAAVYGGTRLYQFLKNRSLKKRAAKLGGI